ncbi:DMT family transporter [uncultured Sulfitobacter sp.]|uniref:DMT family transporter n=1 Tax=uncultured Sulfitobacter sp. TaxID=191468 RepID=UPI0030F9CAFA
MSNKLGIGFVILSMAAFTFEDMFIKLLLVHLPVGQLLCMFGLGTASLFAAIMWVRGLRFDNPDAWGKIPIARMLCEAGAALTFYLALSRVDLTLVAAVYQAAPLVIMLGAAIFLREKVGWRRWLAVLLGLFGVMLIIRPGFAEFDPNSLWAVLSMFLVAGRDLVTRRIHEALPSTLISFQGFAVLMPTGLLWHFSTEEVLVPVSGTYLISTLGGVVFGAIGYYCIVRGMRLGAASVVAPFRYSRILFAMLAGAVVFGERVDAIALLGIGLIVSTGIYSFEREARKGIRAEKVS